MEAATLITCGAIATASILASLAIIARILRGIRSQARQIRDELQSHRP